MPGRRAAFLLIVLAVLGVLPVALASLHFPISYDQATWLTVGRELRHGATPYVDLADTKLPGVYYLGFVVMAVADRTGVAVEAVFYGCELLVLALMLVFLARGVARRGWFSPPEAVALATVVGAASLSFPPDVRGQAEFWLMPALFGYALLLDAPLARRFGRTRRVLAGLAIGSLGWLRPTYALVFVALEVAACIHVRMHTRAWRQAVRRLVNPLNVGLLASAVLLLGHLAAFGLWSAWAQLSLGAASGHASLKMVSPLAALGARLVSDLGTGHGVWLAPALLGLVAWRWLRRPSPPGATRTQETAPDATADAAAAAPDALAHSTQASPAPASPPAPPAPIGGALPARLALLFGATFASAWVLGKAFAYHLLPSELCAAALGAWAVLALGRRARARWRLPAFVTPFVLLAGALAVMLGANADRLRAAQSLIAGRTGPARYRRAVYGPRERLAAYLRQTTRPDDRVFVWDTLNQVYLLADRRPATRFLNSFIVAATYLDRRERVGLVEWEPRYRRRRPPATLAEAPPAERWVLVELLADLARTRPAVIALRASEGQRDRFLPFTERTHLLALAEFRALLTAGGYRRVPWPPRSALSGGGGTEADPFYVVFRRGD